MYIYTQTYSFQFNIINLYKLLGSDYEGYEKAEVKSTKRKRKRGTELVDKVVDDGLFECYQSRLDLYYKQLEEELSLKAQSDNSEEAECHVLRGGLKVPIKIWQNLYRYFL